MRRHRRPSLRRLLPMLGCWLAMLGAWTAPAQETDAAPLVDRLTAFFAGAEVRHVGSPGNRVMEDRIDRLFASSGYAHGAIRFAAPAFQPGPAYLETAGQRVRIYPLHPTYVSPGNFAESNFASRLVYLGRGELADLDAVRGVSLEGVIALMEFDCGDNWLRLLRFGVSGFLFIGADEYAWRDAEAKIYESEVGVARYFVPAAEGALLREATRQAPAGLPVKVAAEPSRWQRQILRNLWVLIPGTDPDQKKDVVVFTAPIDSNGVVPELAMGAEKGANLFLLTELLARFQASPPGHSVLLVAVNAHSQGFRGERELAWPLLTAKPLIESLRGKLANEIRLQEMFLSHYEKLAGLPQTAEMEALLIAMRSLVDDTVGRRISVKDPLVALARSDVNKIKARMLQARRTEASAEERQELEDEKNRHVKVLILFNKIRPQEVLSKLSDAELGILRRHIETVIGRYRTWATQNREELARDEENYQRLTTALHGRKVALVLSLAANWNEQYLGFTSETGTKEAQKFGTNSTLIANKVQAQLGIPSGSLFLDTMTSVGGLPETHYFGDLESGIHVYHASPVRTQAFALRTAYAVTSRAFCPSDTFDRLDRRHLERQFPFLLDYFTALVNDPLITTDAQLGKAYAEANVWATRLRTFEFDEYSASVLPQLPVGDSFVLLTPQDDATTPAPTLVLGDVANVYFQMTDDRATAIVKGLVDRKNYICDAYRFDPDYRRITHAIDAGDVHARTTSNINRGQDDKTVALFACEEYRLLDRADPAQVGDRAIRIDQCQLLDARQNSAPNKFGMAGVKSQSNKWMRLTDGPAAMLASPDDVVKILSLSKIPAIHATDAEPEGIGFDGPVALPADNFRQSADDLSRLNAYRLAKMEGLTNELAAESLRLGNARLDEATQARENRDFVAYLRLINQALGTQFKAYGQILALNNDMLKAVVFYVALLLPFCFFVQKLCFKFVRIEAQMGAFAVLFIATFMVFRFIHPAFKVAQAAEAIFVAFIMGALGVFVILVLHRRFEGEMQALFQSYLGIAAEVGYSTVGQKAMLIGVNNMKRRRIRTSLTTATIVLITFAMLAFSSVSRKMSPTMIARSDTAPYRGLFYQWPASLQMDESTLRAVEEIFSDSADALVVRRWLKGTRSPFAADLAVHGGVDGRTAKVEAILGVPLADQFLLDPAGYPVLPGGRFFSSNQAAEVMLPVNAAEALGITPDNFAGHRIRIAGKAYEVVGLLDDAKLRDLRDLNQLSVVPIQDVKTSGWGANEREANLNVDMSEGDESTLAPIATAKLAVMPVDAVRDLGGLPFSISIVLRDEVPLWEAMDRMLRTTNAKFFVGSPEKFKVGDEGNLSFNRGVYYVGSGYKTSIGGLSRLLVPLLIAGTIILNTMLGSVYERKYEIAVYNAIGLNPTHIGLFFLAEAFVYSVIGSVGGYLIGQLLAMGLIHFGLVAGLNLNFSSLAVVYVILFTIVVVLLSTLYPAWAATRAAVPSGKRKWSLPNHDGTTMQVVFPFIYQPQIAVGAIGYLEQFFARFTEASVGNMIARLQSREQSRDAQDRPVYRVRYDLALAPYDLGVTQLVTFTLSYDDVVQSFRLHMEVVRQSGQDSNWVTVNKPFLERLRKYLMQWRNMEPAQHQVYVQRADAIFHPHDEPED